MFMCNTESALNFIEAVREKTSVFDVLALFQETINRFGFASYLMFDLPDHSDYLDQSILAFGKPEAWFQHYLKNNYVRDDPIVAYSRKRVEPFFWHEAVNRLTIDRQGREIMDAAAAHGMLDGFVVPIIDAFAKQSLVSMSGSVHFLSERDKGALHLIAIYAHATLRARFKSLQAKSDSYNGGYFVARRSI